MSKKWTIGYIVALVLLPIILILFTRLDSPSDLLSPPGLYGENSKIQNAFESSISNANDVILKYPSSGEYQSAFVFYDVDGDEIEEVLVFYSLKSDEDVVRVNILDCVDDEWISVFDEEGYGSDILSIEFNDFYGDGKSEIVVCWRLYESTSSKVLTVHSIDSVDDKIMSVETLVNQSYAVYSISDMDDDNVDELLVLWQDTTDLKLPKSYATLLKMEKDGTFSQRGNRVQLDPAVSSYSSIFVGEIGGKTVTFVDAYKGDDTMITEALYFDEENDTLVAPFVDKESLTNLITKRSPAVSSVDIDGDGNLEIPVAISNALQEEDSSIIPLTAWSIYSDDALSVKQYNFVNSICGYSFAITNGQREKLVVACNKDTGSMTFYDFANQTKGEELFTISVKDTKSITASDEYTFSVTHDDNTYFGTITAVGQAAGFNNELIEDSIVFFDDLK